jgi:hypothetical protein
MYFNSVSIPGGPPVFIFRFGSIVVDTGVILDAESSVGNNDTSGGPLPDASAVTGSMTSYFTTNSQVASSFGLDVQSLAVVEVVMCKLLSYLHFSSSAFSWLCCFSSWNQLCSGYLLPFTIATDIAWSTLVRLPSGLSLGGSPPGCCVVPSGQASFRSVVRGQSSRMLCGPLWSGFLPVCR